MFKSMERIIRWAGKYKGRLYLGAVFSFFSSLTTAIPTMIYVNPPVYSEGMGKNKK